MSLITKFFFANNYLNSAGVTLKRTYNVVAANSSVGCAAASNVAVANTFATRCTMGIAIKPFCILGRGDFSNALEALFGCFDFESLRNSKDTAYATFESNYPKVYRFSPQNACLGYTLGLKWQKLA